MKRILFALTMLALVLPALPQARADVSIDFFYNNLSGGNWIEVEGYGYGWQPELAVSSPNWRPYADGYWAYTDYGWTWISYEDFGWATYHYGRWASLADYGWVWFPGSDLEWGPAWVSWRTGGDYVGWAPLPPRGPGIAYAGQAIGGQVDVEFGIGPAYYNFVDVRFIGEPVLRDRIFPVSQNVTYIDNTVNVTNITVQNNVVYNYGPNYERLSSYSSRPIQRLKIEREPSTDLSTAVKSGALTKVQGDKLVVAAPQKIAKAPAGAAPPKVKTKVAQPKIEKGWTGVANREKLEQKIKTENPKNIPPPTGAAAKGRARGEASPAATAPTAGGSPIASPGAMASPIEKGKGRGRPGREVKPAGESPAAASPAATAAPAERGKGRGRPGRESKPGEPGRPSAEEKAAASPAATEVPREKGKGRGQGRPGATPEEAGSAQEAASPNAPSTSRGRGKQGSEATAEREGGSPPSAPERGKGKGRPSPGGQQQHATPPESGPSESTQSRGRERGQGAAKRQQGGPTETGAAPSEARGGRQKGQGAAPGGPSGGGSAQGAREKPERGKKKGKEESPSPGPQ